MDIQIKSTASSQTTPKEIDTIFQQNELEIILKILRNTGK